MSTALPCRIELYTLKGGKINSINPGVFFLYIGVHVGPAGDITIDQSNTAPWTAFIGLSGNQVILYRALSPGVCQVVKNYSTDPTGLSITSGDVTLSGVTAGDYIMSVKYDPGTLVGFNPPNSPSCGAGPNAGPCSTYNFAVTANNVSFGSAGVLVSKKPK